MSGLEIIRAIQSIHSETLDQIFLAITDLHHENVYILLLPILFWLYDKRFARYLTAVFMVGYWFNNVLKELFDTARPTPDQVRVVRPESSGAFPSGHSMNPLMFWGAIALQAKRTWITASLGVVIFLIGLSRLYLGVHWPLDVLGGWAIGAAMLWGFEVTRDFWVGANQKLGTRLFWAVAVPLGAFLVSFALGQVPPLEGDPAHKDFFVVLGAFLGFNVGVVLEEEYVGFNPRLGGIGVQLLKVVVGLAIVLVMKEGLKLVLPDNGLGDAARYMFVTLSASVAAPWLFKRFVAAPPAGRTLAR